jgi:hypothetical protein
VVTPGGAAAVGHRGAVTAGPGGVVATGGRAGIAAGPGGVVAGRTHGAVAAGPYGAVAAGGRTVAGRGVAGGAFYGTRHVAAATLRDQGLYVRRGFGHYNAFRPGWYATHPGVWFSSGWAAATAWGAATWPVCSGFLGYTVEVPPVYYDYGTNVICQDGNVYYGDQVIATEADYAQQAVQLADTGRQAPASDEDKWQPLGVFAMTKGDEAASNDIFQLALNKDGVLRGNYYNATTDTATPLYGSLDRKTQRLAWTVGDKKDVVYETGLYNLTLEQTTLLAHLGKDRTEQYNLFRVEQPKEGDGQAK